MRQEQMDFDGLDLRPQTHSEQHFQHKTVSFQMIPGQWNAKKSAFCAVGQLDFSHAESILTIVTELYFILSGEAGEYVLEDLQL